MISSPLNVFQRLVLQWDALHPYNAVQVMTLPGMYEHERLVRALNRALKESGIGSPDIRLGRYCFADPAEPASLVHLGPDTSTEHFISSQLNYRFNFDGRFPLRAFAGVGEDRTVVGMSYWHWIADSFAMRMLMRRWLDRILQPDGPDPPPLSFPTTGYLRALRWGASLWSPGRALWDSVRWTARLKRARRVALAGDMTARFTRHDAPRGLVQALRDRARARGVTLNDVFLAVMAQCVDLLPMLERPGKRFGLALGTIVDLRPGMRPSERDSFGMFLGFTTSVCKPEHMGDFDTLLNELADQNRRLRAKQAAQSSMIRMCMGLLMGHLLHRRKLLNFYRRRVPISAGISNVNLNPTWAGDYHPDRLLDYLRVSPTGPMAPIVFTPTTLGDRLNLGLTCRAVLLSPQSQRSLGDAFIARLVRFAGS